MWICPTNYSRLNKIGLLFIVLNYLQDFFDCCTYLNQEYYWIYWACLCSLTFFRITLRRSELSFGRLVTSLCGIQSLINAKHLFVIYLLIFFKTFFSINYRFPTKSSNELVIFVKIGILIVPNPSFISSSIFWPSEIIQ